MKKLSIQDRIILRCNYLEAKKKFPKGLLTDIPWKMMEINGLYGIISEDEKEIIESNFERYKGYLGKTPEEALSRWFSFCPSEEEMLLFLAIIGK